MYASVCVGVIVCTAVELNYRIDVTFFVVVMQSLINLRTTQ